jgi:RNA polymerase sigma factor (sigma-70 family)
MTAPRCQIRSKATEPPTVDASEPDRDNDPSRVGLVRPVSKGHGRRLERLPANRSCMAAPQDDEQIGVMLKRLAAGEATAHEDLIVWASERMREIAHRMLRTFPTVRRWEETDDVVQNAAIRLDRALRQTLPLDVRGLLGLAATQVRRELLDLAKKHRGPESYGGNHETNFQRLDGELRAKVDDAAAQCDPLETLERWTRLHAAADSLPAEEREVFHMCWYLGLKQEDIARLLDCSTRTVKRRWESAKEILATAMPGPRPE